MSEARKKVDIMGECLPRRGASEQNERLDASAAQCILLALKTLNEQIARWAFTGDGGNRHNDRMLVARITRHELGLRARTRFHCYRLQPVSKTFDMVFDGGFRFVRQR